MSDTLIPRYALAGRSLVGAQFRMVPVEGVTWTRLAVGEPSRDLGVALPSHPAVVTDGRLTAVWCGPGQYYLLGEIPANLANATDLTGARATIELSGSAARTVLAKLIAIDLHDEAFGPGAASVTLCGHIDVTLWRLGPVYAVSCARSFADSLWRQLAHAAEEFTA